MVEDKMRRRREFLTNAVYFGLIGGGVFLLVKFALPVLLPFVIGFGVAFLLRPVSRLLCGRLHLGGRLCGILVVVVAYALLVGLLWLVGGKLVEAAQSFAENASHLYEQYIAPLLAMVGDAAVQTAQGAGLSGQTDQLMQGVAQGLRETVSSLSQSLLLWVAQLGMGIPDFLVGLFFAVLSSVFISADYTRIASFLTKLLPKSKRPVVFETKGYFVETAGKYVRAYFILMIITFVELTAGLWIIGAGNPVGAAAAIAVCDALPLLGTGIVLLPWCILSFAMGNLPFAIGLLVVYIVVSLVRGILEPKILGKQLGLHPLATLLAVYVGMKLLGVLGMILFPILLQIGVCLWRSRQPAAPAKT